MGSPMCGHLLEQGRRRCVLCSPRPADRRPMNPRVPVKSGESVAFAGRGIRKPTPVPEATQSESRHSSSGSRHTPSGKRHSRFHGLAPQCRAACLRCGVVIELSELELVWPPRLFAEEAQALLAAGMDSEATLGWLLVEAFHGDVGLRLYKQEDARAPFLEGYVYNPLDSPPWDAPAPTRRIV